MPNFIQVPQVSRFLILTNPTIVVTPAISNPATSDLAGQQYDYSDRERCWCPISLTRWDGVNPLRPYWCPMCDNLNHIMLQEIKAYTCLTKCNDNRVG